MSERLPRNMIRHIYSKADLETKARMRAASKWMHADTGMPAPAPIYGPMRLKMWGVDRTLRRRGHQLDGLLDGNVEGLMNAHTYGPSEAGEQILQIKRHYMKMKRTDRGQRVDTLAFLSVGLGGAQGGGYGWTVDEIMRKAKIPKMATVDEIMSRVLQWGNQVAKRPNMVRVMPHVVTQRAQQEGRQKLKANKANFFKAQPGGRRATNRAQARIIRRAARRLAA